MNQNPSSCGQPINTSNLLDVLESSNPVLLNYGGDLLDARQVRLNIHKYLHGTATQDRSRYHLVDIIPEQHRRPEIACGELAL